MPKMLKAAGHFELP